MMLWIIYMHVHFYSVMYNCTIEASNLLVISYLPEWFAHTSLCHLARFHQVIEEYEKGIEYEFEVSFSSGGDTLSMRKIGFWTTHYREIRKNYLQAKKRLLRSEKTS